MELKDHLPWNTEKPHWEHLARCLENSTLLEASGDCYVSASLHREALDAYMRVGSSTVEKCISVIRLTNEKHLVEKFLNWIATEVHQLPDSAAILAVFDLQVSLGQPVKAIESLMKHVTVQQVSHPVVHDTSDSRTGGRTV